MHDAGVVVVGLSRLARWGWKCIRHCRDIRARGAASRGGSCWEGRGERKRAVEKLGRGEEGAAERERERERGRQARVTGGGGVIYWLDPRSTVSFSPELVAATLTVEHRRALAAALEVALLEEEIRGRHRRVRECEGQREIARPLRRVRVSSAPCERGLLAEAAGFETEVA
jgi:hypothetical protein